MAPAARGAAFAVAVRGASVLSTGPSVPVPIGQRPPQHGRGKRVRTAGLFSVAAAGLLGVGQVVGRIRGGLLPQAGRVLVRYAEMPPYQVGPFQVPQELVDYVALDGLVCGRGKRERHGVGVVRQQRASGSGKMVGK